MRLKAEHISYKYPGGSREVLSDVSLELGSTDRLGIAAPSGFGKRRLFNSGGLPHAGDWTCLCG